MTTIHFLSFQQEPLRSTYSIRSIFIKNAMFMTRIGVYEREQSRLQRVRLNMEIHTHDHPPSNDELREVVCYDKIMSDVRERLNGGHTKLIETLVEDICAIILRHEGVIQVTTRLEKLSPIPEAESVAVEITRS